MNTFSFDSLGRAFTRICVLRTTVAAWTLLAAVCTFAVPVRAIAPPTTATTLTAAPSNSVKAGAAVTLTATVTMNGSPVNVGLVTFCDATAARCVDSAIFGTAQLTNQGTATLKLILGVGSYSINAVFAGTTSSPGSSSSPLSLTVAGNSTYVSSTTIAANGSGPYSLTGTVKAFGRALPTGTVSFVDASDGDSVAGTAPLDAATQTWSFANSVVGSLGSGSCFSAAGDFNRDGIPDLVVVNCNSNNVSVLLGKGDGTFRPQVLYAVGASPAAVAVGDFNGDGYLDLAVVNSSSDSNNISILLGNGDGTFQPAVVYPVGNSPSSIAVGDFNGDGIPDLAVANNDQFGTVSVLLGNGDGTFQPQAAYSTGSSPRVLAVADLNNNGILDIVTANTGDNNVSVLMGNGDGTFAAAVAYSAGTSPYAVAVGDVNADGNPDLLVANYGSNTVSVLLGNGDGTFQPQVTYPTGSKPTQVAVRDFNDDSSLDVAVSNSGDNTVSLLLGNGNGTFKPQVTYPVGHAPSAITAVDLNGDGVVDLVVSNLADSTLSVLLGQQTETATASGVNLPGIGTQNVFASYPGDSSRAASQSTNISLTGPTYTITAASNSFTVASGGTLSVNITASPANGVFDHSVTMSVTGLPSGASASFNPANVTPAKSGAQTALTIQFAAEAAAKSSRREQHYPLAAFTVLLGFALVAGKRKGLPGSLSMIVLFALLMGTTMTLSSCTGFSTAAPAQSQPQTYEITVVGTSGSLHPSTTITVVVE